MINLRKITELLTEYSTALILFNIHDSSYIVTSEIEVHRALNGNMLKGNRIVKGVPEKLKPFVENQDDYADLFDYSKNYESDIKTFVSLHENEFSDLNNDKRLTFRKFVKIVKDKGLYNSWIDYFEKSISYDVYYWCVTTNQLEEEADEAQYSKIIQLLNEYKTEEFERCIPDKVLFNIFDDYDPFSFVVLGNAGVTKGINFILSYNAVSYFKILQSENSSNVDLRVLNNLSNLISFYTDGDDEYSFEKNPFEKNKEFSSIHMVSGCYMKNRLTKSVANLCVKYLTKAIKLLKRFVDSSSFSKIDIDNIFTVDENLVVSNISNDNRVFIPVDVDRDCLFAIDKGITGNESVDFALCGVNSYLTDQNDSRIVYPTMMLVICNHETGKIRKAILGKPDIYYPLTSLSDCIQQELADFRIPRIVNVNNILDSFFAELLFAKFIKEKKTIINMVNHRLFTDDAIERFDEEFAKLGSDIQA